MKYETSKPIFYDDSAGGGGRHQQGVGNLRRDFTLLLITFFISVLVSPICPNLCCQPTEMRLHPLLKKNRTRVALKRTGRGAEWLPW